MNATQRGTTPLTVSPVHETEDAADGVAGANKRRGPCEVSLSPTCSLSNSMRHLFHFTASDAVILAMEHNSHSKLLALSTSKNEICVTSTSRIPLGGGAHEAKVGQQEWDPAEATVLLDSLPHPCTFLAWGPWQHGTYLACVCRGWEVRFYRLSHGQWSLDEIVEVQGCTCVAFSCYFTLACVTADGNLLIFAQTKDKESSRWSICSDQFLEEEKRNLSVQLSNRGRSVKSYTCVGWDETGNLLAVGSDEGGFCVFYILDEGHCIGAVAYSSYSFSQSCGGFRQVSWAPGAGRSFLVLATLTSNELALFLFQRPRDKEEGGDRPRTFAEAQQLHLLAHTKVNVEDVTELSWNTSGVRFVTAHTDGKVCLWALEVSYSRGHNLSFRDVENATSSNSSSSSENCGAQYVSNSRELGGLKLTVLVKKVCEQHLHHGGS